VLLDGINHVAVMTTDTDRLVAFYREMFDATSMQAEDNDALKLTMIHVGPHTELNVFEMKSGEQQPHVPMFGRGPLDHMGLQAKDKAAFDEIRERLIKAGATDGFVTDFGPVYSLFFVDPDGLEGEVLMTIEGADPAKVNPPGTPAPEYERVQ
jgi:catechol 2,3-dioxygenase-like lactoylglutathione lyase family enzyme